MSNKMTEEIIIDGVNVTGCDGLNRILLPLKQCDLLQFKTKDGGIAGRWCTDHYNCYYKQLKRLEQENFALTQESQQKSQTICELEQENKELKETIEAFKTMATVPTRMYNECERERCKYGRALEEIRDYCKFNFVSVNPILNKINEVLG